jgi:DeoR family transcriptional regulator, glycerol-3-phosphate regulon repressor
MEADSGAAYGPSANAYISRFQVRHVFLSIGGFNNAIGPMNAQVHEADLAIAALQCATHRVILADSSKFTTPAFVKVCDYSGIEVIVTENPPPTEFFATLNAANTKLVIAAVA